ncbi:MAG: type II secretion system F family protein [Kiritimatiellaeota bacterium]|nr:type II secretion system F family protein [Kiritimatiellota bacterium]
MIPYFPYLAAILTGATVALLTVLLHNAFSSGAQEYTATYSSQTARQFEDLFLFIPPKRIADIGMIAAAVVFLLLAGAFFNASNLPLTAVGLVIASLAAFGAFQMPRQFLKILKDRRRVKFNIQLVDALSQMSNSLRAGFSLGQSFEGVADTGENPIAQEFQLFLQHQRVGIPFAEAMADMERRVASDDLALVAATIDIARKTGGNLTEVFDKIALTIRERLRIESRVRTLTAQGRLQGIVVGIMPIAFGGIMTLLKPNLMIPFLQSTGGVIACVVIVLLLIAGAWMIRKIVNIDV